MGTLRAACLLGLLPLLPAQGWETIAPDFRNVRGINYVATYPSLDGTADYFGCASSTAMWRYYDATPGGTADHVDEQLGWMKQAGMNSVRVFLSYPYFLHDSSAFRAKFQHFIGLCDRHRIRVMPVLWDDVQLNEPDYGDLIGANPPHVNISRWIRNPGVSKVKQWDLDGQLPASAIGYLDAALQSFDLLPHVLLMWDVYNEPVPLRYQKFVIQETLQHIKTNRPNHKTIASWRVTDAVPFSVEIAVDPRLDVIGIHPYGHTRAFIESMIWDATHVVHPATDQVISKPIIATEIGNPGEGQSYQDALRLATTAIRHDLSVSPSTLGYECHTSATAPRGVGFMPWASCIGPGIASDKYPLKHVTGLFYGDPATPNGGRATVREKSAVMAFVDVAQNLHQVPGTYWTASTLIEKPHTALDFVEQKPTPTTEDDYAFIELMLSAPLPVYELAIMNLAVVGPLRRRFTRITNACDLSIMSQNNCNPWLATPGVLYSAADRSTFQSEMFVMGSPAWVQMINQRHYPTAGGATSFTFGGHPDDFRVLAREFHRWGHLLVPYFRAQGAP